VPRYAEQFVQQVAQATDIVELIGQYVALKKRGKEFVGLCPFHDDHAPSLNVSPAKQIYKCFACGAGGGVYQFVMAYEKLTFPEAVRSLAERAGIPLPQEVRGRPQGEGLSKAELAECTTFAARFYREQLNGPAGRQALQYARDRQLTDESIRRFGLGYAPDAWDGLLNAGREKGFSERILLAAGLAVRRESGSGCYDRLRDRLVFPILDTNKRVVALAGRALSDEQTPKYLNTNETILFDKSSTLYALNWAREGISAAGRAIVVEGYLDALIPLQMGVTNVVASMGTSLTDGQARMLSRYAREVLLLFDADAAGAAAAERALELFLAQRLHVRVATIPAGKDPCDLCLTEGVEEFRRRIDEAPDALQYIWSRRRQEYERAGGNLAQQRRVIDDFLRLIVSSSAYGAIDPVRRGQLLQHIGQMLRLPASDLEREARRLRRSVPRSAQRPQAEDAAPRQPEALGQRRVLEVLLNREDLWETARERIGPDDFADPEFQAIARHVWKLGAAGSFTCEQLLSSEEMSEHGRLLAELITSGQKRGNHERTLSEAIEHIRYRRSRQETEERKSGELTEQVLRDLSAHLKQSDLRRFPRIK